MEMSRDISSHQTDFSAYNFIAALVLVADKDGAVIFANNSVEVILGYTPQEVLGHAWYELTDTAFLDKEERLKAVSDMALGGLRTEDRHLYESRLRAKDGNIVWTQWTNMRLESGHVIGVGQDITEKKKLKDSLIEKNRENELLLQEIHHRVKNNLQIISSLLNLQFDKFEDDHLEKAILKSKARIRSMALVHNMLNESNDLSAIDFGLYLSELCDVVSQSYECNHRHDIDIKHCGSHFDVDLTINLGIILTELLSNVFEHAYEEEERKTVEVHLDRADNKHTLRISDFGKGMSHKKSEPTDGLGLELVNSLCGQINGNLSLKNGTGTTVQLEF